MKTQATLDDYHQQYDIEEPSRLEASKHVKVPDFLRQHLEGADLDQYLNKGNINNQVETFNVA